MEGWKKENLGNLLELVYGISLPKKNRIDGNIPVYGSNGIVGFHDAAIVNEPGIIIGRKGSAGNVHISKVPFCPIDTTFYITQQHSKLDIEYLYYALNFLDLKRILGDVGVPGLNRDMAYLEELIYPSDKAEQRKIAHVLNTVQKAIEQQDKLIRTTTELKKALMQKLFTEGTRGESQKETEIGLVPESWKVARIGEMCKFSKKPRGLNIQTPVPFIPMELVPLNEMKIENYELRDKVSSGTYVENGDLLLAKITPSFENGKQGFVSIDKPYAYATTEVIPIKEIDELSDKFYLFYYLLKDDIRKQLADKMEGSTGRQRLSKTILAETLIPKPSLNEQKEIADLFMSFDRKKSLCNKKKQTLTALFKTLLYELMTGQCRVHELEFEKENLLEIT